MKSGKVWTRVLLAISIAGISLGALFFSGGMCGGGSSHYQIGGSFAAK